MDTREKVFEFIVRYKSEHDGIAPTYEEIMQACGINAASNVNYILKALEADGRIHKGEGYRNLSVPGGRWIYDPESVVV